MFKTAQTKALIARMRAARPICEACKLVVKFEEQDGTIIRAERRPYAYVKYVVLVNGTLVRTGNGLQGMFLVQAAHRIWRAKKKKEVHAFYNI